jgi:hypothetical protein
MVCAGECFLYELKDDIRYSYRTRMNIEIEMPTFHRPVLWKLHADKKLDKEEHKVNMIEEK